MPTQVAYDAQTGNSTPRSGVRSAIAVYPDTLPCPKCGHQIPLRISGDSWTVRSPGDVAARMIPRLTALEREELWVLTLNAKNRVLDAQALYRGNVSASLVRVGELFAEAVRRHGAGVVLCHNHPSGDPTPSPDDLHLTAEAISAGRLLDIDVLDHIVIAGGQYVSLRDRGVSFDRPRA